MFVLTTGDNILIMSLASKVMRVGSKTLVDPFFEKVLQNKPSSQIIGVLGKVFGDDYNSRAVGRSENPGVPVVGGHNLSPLVEIGLTDLPKSGCAMAPRDDRPE